MLRGLTGRRAGAFSSPPAPARSRHHRRLCPNRRIRTPGAVDGSVAIKTRALDLALRRQASIDSVAGFVHPKILNAHMGTCYCRIKISLRTNKGLDTWLLEFRTILAPRRQGQSLFSFSETKLLLFYHTHVHVRFLLHATHTSRSFKHAQRSSRNTRHGLTAATNNRNDTGLTNTRAYNVTTYHR